MWIWSTLQVCSVPGWKEDPLSYRDRILPFRVGRRGGDPLVKMPILQLGRRQVQKTTCANFVLANEFESSRYSRFCSEDIPCSRLNSLGRELGQSARRFNTSTLYSLIWKGKRRVMYSRIQTSMGQQHSPCILPESYNYWHDCCISPIKLWKFWVKNVFTFLFFPY